MLVLLAWRTQDNVQVRGIRVDGVISDWSVAGGCNGPGGWRGHDRRTVLADSTPVPLWRG
jgi:hypothetical protein